MPVIVKYSSELYHYGIKGQKWGVRRFQNPDGTLTPEGTKRYNRQEALKENRIARYLMDNANYAGKRKLQAEKLYNKQKKRYLKDPSAKNARRLYAANIVSSDANFSYDDFVRESKKHYDELVSRYGKDAVKPIEYTRRNIMKRSFKMYNPYKYLTYDENVSASKLMNEGSRKSAVLNPSILNNDRQFLFDVYPKTPRSVIRSRYKKELKNSKWIEDSDLIEAAKWLLNE